MDIELACPVCEAEHETLEHLFFKCPLSKRLWRASHLGFDFDSGNPMSVIEWLEGWFKSALDKRAIWDSAYMLWTIWCNRNDKVFRGEIIDLDVILARFAALRSSFDPEYKSKPKSLMDSRDIVRNEPHMTREAEVSHIYSASNGVISVANVRHFVTDGAWNSSTLKRIAAWVKNTGQDAEEAQQVMKCRASSATLVEIRAGILALQWAKGKDLKEVCISTDSMEFVKGLNNPMNAPVLTQPALSDSYHPCTSFDYVKVMKVSRSIVTVAHNLVKEAMNNM